MPTYLYCLLGPGSDRPPEGLTGHARQAVRLLRAGDLRAWVSDVPPGTSLERTAGAARLHDSVCAAALAGGETPLPARFGQRFESDDACVEEVIGRERELLSALRLVAGCVEMTVHVTLDSEEPGASADMVRDAGELPDVGPGRRHLERLRYGLYAEHNVHRRAVAAAERLRRVVGAAVRAEKVRVGLKGDVVVAHLVAREALDDYRAGLDGLGAGGGNAIRWSGPYVPYSFTG